MQIDVHLIRHILTLAVVLHDLRITTAVIIVGCPDYISLMSDRARLSKLQSWTQSKGSKFLGSKDFPPSLLEAVKGFDPAGVLLGPLAPRGRDIYKETPAAEEKQRLSQLMRPLHGKRILNMAGGADELVPYRCGQPFIRWIQRAAQPGGWSDVAITLEDIVFDGVGHEMSPDMAAKASEFVQDSLELMLKEMSGNISKI